MSYHGNITKLTEDNHNFRSVVHTGKFSQLVVMEIPSGGDIGFEVHDHVEQTLFFQSGFGVASLDGVDYHVSAGDVVVVTPGTKHNFINTGDEPLKIFTVYAPPNHIDGRVHVTRIDADADEADEEFGHAAHM